MGKGSFFSGQPIFAQVLKLLEVVNIDSAVDETGSDDYYKTFKTRDHLMTMLFAIFNHCTSLREVVTGLLAAENRIEHMGLKDYPRRATLSDANKNRNPDVFGLIYHKLLQAYQGVLPDSRTKSHKKNLYVFDSTTITLFKEILKAAGTSKLDGRRKGGIKVHTLYHTNSELPVMIRYSAAAKADSVFLKEVNIPKGSVIVFDKGYSDYKSYNRLEELGITWVTRLKADSVFSTEEKREVSETQKFLGIKSDHFVVLGHDHHGKATKVNARIIRYKDPLTRKTFEFLTNNRKLSPTTIAGYYKKRWQIETFFKHIKQNFPLQYFLGDNENAIKIQIWCVLIANLLLKVLKQGTGTKMAFSNMSSLIRIHIMTYMDIAEFLRSPEKSLLQRIRRNRKQKPVNPTIFDP